MQDELKKILFFINPRSSKSNLDLITKLIEDEFNAKKTDYKIVLSQKNLKIEDSIQEELKNNFDIIVACGGDGTVSSVAHCLTNTNVILGIIPTGTANVIAKELNIPININESLKLIVDSNYKLIKLDALKAFDKFYFLRISAGLSSITIKNLNRKLKKYLGPFAYLYTGINSYFKYKYSFFNLNIDDEEFKYKASDIVVTNLGKLFLPGVNIDPNIKPNDGILDVIVFKTLSAKAALKILYFKIIRKNKSLNELDHIDQAKKIIIDCNNKMPVQGDGDIIGYTPVKIELVSDAITVIVPD